jgi:M6 family metalloprotease-like protein
MKLFRLIAAILAVLSTAIAAPANPEPSVYYQPDGTETPLIYLKGNQFYNWLCDDKGYTVIKDEHGWYNYAMKTDDGDIVSSGVKIGSKNPKKLGIVPGLMHDEHKRPMNGLVQGAESTTERRSLLQVPENALCGYAGSKNDPCRLRGIVFLVQFSDHRNRTLPSQQEYDMLFNNNGPDKVAAPTGSVSDVYFENSYQTFIMQSYVTPWLKVSRTEAQTVDGNLGLNMAGTRQTWNEAMAMFDNMGVVDLNTFDKDKDGNFDCVVILHSGVPAETGGIDCESGKDTNGRIWSHATSSNLYSTAGGITKVDRFYVAAGVFGVCPPLGKGAKWNIARVAVIAHECAHFLGLPDLYDTVGGQGIGNFDLMGKSTNVRHCCIMCTTVSSNAFALSQPICGDGTIINGTRLS